MILSIFLLSIWLGLLCAFFYGVVECTRILEQVKKEKDDE